MRFRKIKTLCSKFKKIIKRKMDRRPKKLRPSDVTRNNVNLHKCITKVENAPSEYTMISAAGIFIFHHFNVYYHYHHKQITSN